MIAKYKLALTEFKRSAKSGDVEYILVGKTYWKMFLFAFLHVPVFVLVLGTSMHLGVAGVEYAAGYSKPLVIGIAALGTLIFARFCVFALGDWFQESEETSD